MRQCEKCGGHSARHEPRHIELGPDAACVDVPLADLVLACWAAGIRTDESCQDLMDDESDLGFLAFRTVGDFLLFGSILAGFGVGESWEWWCSPIDQGEEWPEVVFLSSVVFPLDDALEATEAILESAKVFGENGDLRQVVTYRALRESNSP